jgi:phospholipase/lecithinase/hemolysin
LFAGAPAPGGAPICDDYAFFDNVHPTTQVLQRLGDELIAVVPEPGTGLLMMFGLAVLSAGGRREVV